MLTPSWYLDPLVARQKRQVHRAWIRNAVGGRRIGTALKADLFEEAHGDDRILDGLFPQARLSLGIDIDEGTVGRAARQSIPFQPMVCDVRALALGNSVVDVAVSTSTLDHFSSKREIERSLDELSRVLRPGGALLVTLDNPRNPMYHPLRWMSRRGWTPFELGETVSLAALEKMLIDRDFTIQSKEYLIHNPRGVSTILFLALRRSLGRFADAPIRGLLAAFAIAGRFPSRSITGCFVAIAAVRRPR